MIKKIDGIIDKLRSVKEAFDKIENGVRSGSISQQDYEDFVWVNSDIVLIMSELLSLKGELMMSSSQEEAKDNDK